MANLAACYPELLLGEGLRDALTQWLIECLLCQEPQLRLGALNVAYNLAWALDHEIVGGEESTVGQDVTLDDWKGEWVAGLTEALLSDGNPGEQGISLSSFKIFTRSRKVQ
jgi:hypothetical protein